MPVMILANISTPLGHVNGANVLPQVLLSFQQASASTPDYLTSS